MRKYEEVWDEFKCLTELKDTNSYNLCGYGDSCLKDQKILIMIYHFKKITLHNANVVTLRRSVF